MLTKEFYEECHRIVRSGIRKGWIVCPPLERPVEREPPVYRADKPCSVCGVMVSMQSHFQKMCYPCSIASGRKRDRERRLKLKLQKQDSNSKNEKAKAKRKTT